MDNILYYAVQLSTLAKPYLPIILVVILIFICYFYVLYDKGNDKKECPKVDCNSYSLFVCFVFVTLCLLLWTKAIVIPAMNVPDMNVPVVPVN